MEVVSNICAILLVVDIIAIPVLMVIFIVRACMKKSKKWFGIAAGICAACIIPLAVIGTFTDPSTYCEHEYTVIEEAAPTCTQRGKIVRHCALCERDDIEYIDKLGHDMQEISRREATQDAAGEVVYQCSRCDEKETELLKKLPKPEATQPTQKPTEPAAPEPTESEKEQTIEFDKLRLTFGEYSFTKVEQKYSEHNGKTVVKIPVTVTNLSKDPHSLNMLYYKTFGSEGTESDSLWLYFEDDISSAGDLLPGKSYTKYIHILYDGDGIYTIVFDDWWYDKETVEINVVKK